MIADTQGLGEQNVRQPMQRQRGAFNLQPLRALKAVRRLIADKEDTVQVFEIMRALSGKAVTRGYRRLISTPEGGRIAYERDEFAERLSDPAWLAQFGPGTVGAAYRDFIAPRGLSAEGLAEESRKIPETDIDAAHPLAWYARRMRDVHDVWHVLTGYGTDALGEVCVVAFSYQQTRSLGFAVIALAGARQFQKTKIDQPYGQAVQEARRNGKAAAWLPAVDLSRPVRPAAGRGAPQAQHRAQQRLPGDPAALSRPVRRLKNRALRRARSSSFDKLGTRTTFAGVGGRNAHPEFVEGRGLLP